VTEDKITEPPTENTPESIGPSELLRAAREKLGLSQKEVADRLFLTTTYIKNIDDGEFDKLPKPAFVKGYLRTYARVVELSGDEVVALYEASVEADEPLPEIRGVTEEDVGIGSITGPVLQTGIIGLVGLIGVIVLIWFLVSGDDSTVGESTSPLQESNPPGALALELAELSVTGLATTDALSADESADALGNQIDSENVGELGPESMTPDVDGGFSINDGSALTVAGNEQSSAPRGVSVSLEDAGIAAAPAAKKKVLRLVAAPSLSAAPSLGAANPAKNPLSSSGPVTASETTFRLTPVASINWYYHSKKNAG
jgi:cytoskeleton protein RodZ